SDNCRFQYGERTRFMTGRYDANVGLGDELSERGVRDIAVKSHTIHQSQPHRMGLHRASEGVGPGNVELEVDPLFCQPARSLEERDLVFDAVQAGHMNQTS